MENRVRECGVERDGLGGVEGLPKELWQWWPIVVVEDDETSLTILPFGEVSKNFNWWVL